MIFSEYKNLSAVIKEFQLQYQEKPFETVKTVAVPPNLVADIRFNLSELAYDGSEAIICETLIFPILKEVWKEFTHELMLWSHQSLVWSDKLSGIPDYLFSKQSALGKIVMDKPFVAVVEAKKDDFTGGWGQCAAEMYAVQQVNQEFNQDNNLIIFGIVSNGRIWEFASLHRNIFVKYTTIANINNLEELYSFLRHILFICKKQL